MNGAFETKSEIRARIHELERLRDALGASAGPVIHDELDKRIQELHRDLDGAQEDLSSNIIRSHRALCEVKRMDERAAYGHDPAVYYTMGVCGEAGEMANAIVKAMRNGEDKALVLKAVMSELPDVIIYSFVLAHVLNIDLAKLVNEKVDVVVRRAHEGYYGGPLPAHAPGALSKE